MKNIKTMIIAGIILLVFIIASVVVINLPQKADTDDSAMESTQETKKETVYVINEDPTTLTHFTIVPTQREVNEDTAYAYASQELDVEIIREEDDKGNVNYSYKASPDPGKFEYDTSMFRSMTYSISSISAKSLVEEHAADISVYGLDQPTVTIKATFEGGKNIDILVGSKAPVDDDYYCMTSESDAVYTIGSYVDSLFVRKPIEYRDIELFPVYTEEEVYTNINWVKLTDREGNEIEIQLDDKLENEYNTENSQYVMLQPYQVSGNTSTIQSNILDIVSTLTLGGIIEDITEEEYAEYGLHNPAKLEMTDIAGNEVHLLVGSTCQNPEYTYCMLENTDTLLYCPTSAFSWIGTSYVQFMLRTIWVYNIEELSGIDIQIGEDSYQMEVDHYVKKNANGNDADGVTGTLNGQEIEESNVRRLFIKCLYFRIVDNLTEEEKKQIKDVDPYATIDIHIKPEGSDKVETHTLELIPISDRKYALSVDGVVEYYCNKKNLTELHDSLGYVLEGDVLDLSFG